MDIRIRLIEGPTPSGEIRALDLARISGSLHEISIRLGRHQATSTRPGRSHRSTEELAELRLAELRGGSTVLGFHVGPPDMLPIEIEEMRQHQEQLGRVLDGLARDSRPNDVPDDVADAVGSLAQALRVAADKVELSIGAAAPAVCRTADIHRETWATPRSSVSEDVVTITGRLEKVDIASHDLRIRDDVGSALGLTNVAADIQAGALIGRRVQASGQAVRDRGGRLTGIDEPMIDEQTAAFGAGLPSPLTAPEIAAGYARTEPGTGLDLTDEEYDAFFEAIGR